MPRCDIPDRTFRFAVRVIEVCEALERRSGIMCHMIKQLFDSATSIGANVEEGQGAQSSADFLTKYSIALKEARETHYWLRLIAARKHIPPSRLDDLISEANEIESILTASVKTLKAKRYH